MTAAGRAVIAARDPDDPRIEIIEQSSVSATRG